MKNATLDMPIARDGAAQVLAAGLALYELQDAVFAFIEGGLLSQGSGKPSQVAACLTSLRAACAQRGVDLLGQAARAGEAQAVTREALRAARKAALAQFVVAFRQQRTLNVKDLPVPWLAYGDEAWFASVVRRAAGTLVDAPKGPFRSPVAQALAMCEYNRQRAEQRLVCLAWLSSTVKPYDPEQYARVWDALWQRHVYAALAELRMAVLVGGAALERTRRRIAEQMSAREMSVMEYLGVDGLAPSRWLADTEDALRADIAARAA